MKHKRYQDYVIKDGQLVGDFEDLYRDFDDPWNQSREDHMMDTRRSIAVDYCRRLSSKHLPSQVCRVLEYGCGFGHLTEALRLQGFSAVGVDVSHEAIRKARARNPQSVFLKRSISDPDVLPDFDPDIIVLAEITWYVLEDLDQFLVNLRRHAANRGDRPTFLIHLLSTYAPGVQQYGLDFFTDLDGILEYFDRQYLESGFVCVPRSDDPHSRGTYFVARVPALVE